MVAGDTCAPQHIAYSTSAEKLDTVTVDYNKKVNDYLTCLGPEEVGNYAIQKNSATMADYNNQVTVIKTMQDIILGQLHREAASENTLTNISEFVKSEEEKLHAEIDRVRSDIRTEKRKFLDASPSESTAVSGLYFTRQPDNQILIAFLSCFGSFLLLAGLLVLMNHIPLPYFSELQMGERVKFVVLFWATSLFLTYMFFIAFT